VTAVQWAVKSARESAKATVAASDEAKELQSEKGTECLKALH